jgi:large subunit ribosomal protein L5
MVPEFRTIYQEKIFNYLKKEFSLSNDLEVPKILKVIVNTGFGSNSSVSVQRAFEIVKMISGQYPVVRRAKKSVADFNIREGSEIGVKATCRGDMAYMVMQRLLYALLNGSSRCPLLKSSSVVCSKNVFSITVGISDTTLFDGIVIETSGANIGCSITIVGKAKSRDEFVSMLIAFGFPFADVAYKYKIWEGK